MVSWPKRIKIGAKKNSYKKISKVVSPWQRWSPLEHNLMSLYLTSKLKSLALTLASKPASPRKWPVHGSRTALFFDLLKMDQSHNHFISTSWSAPETSRKFMKTFFFWKMSETLRNFLAKTFSLLWRTPKNLRFFWAKTFFFWKITRKILSLASKIPVLGLERVCSREVGPWPRIFFVSLTTSLVSSTPLLHHGSTLIFFKVKTSWMPF